MKALLLLLCSLTAAVSAEAEWPPRELLVKSVAAGVEAVLKTQDAATGRFGSQPWVCTDQNVLFPLAVAWATADPLNPWHHHEGLLEAIARGGEALVDDQDEQGRWIFRKKDNSTWGMIHMPWTYSRWIRAYALVKEALPAASRARWEEGLRLGFGQIDKIMAGGVHNIPTHHAMALAIAGEALAEPTWREHATAFMARVVAKQDPGGFWSEHSGPVVGYNEVYVDALGVYYGVTRDEVVLPALRRAALFHAALLWPDGSAVTTVDERQIYHATREMGTVGFSWTPEGRGYLLQQTLPHREQGRLLPADWAAAMLLYGGQGSGLAPAAAGDQGRAVLGNHEAVIERRKPWQWCFSAYTTKPIANRWIQDRHNLVDIFHDELGLVAGGGNTKLQPYWSTFTLGDPELLKHTPGDESPDFVPAIPLLWYPTAATIATAGDTPELRLSYGEATATVNIAPRADGALQVTYRASGATQRAEAHLPLLNRGGRLRLGSGQVHRLGEADLVVPASATGGSLTWQGLHLELPPGASLRWPARQHDPYRKDGRSPLATAKLVVVIPLPDDSPRGVTLSRRSEPPFEGIALEARDLPVTCTADSYLKRLDDLGSQFLGAKKLGEAMTFTLPAQPPGKYELLAEFVMAHSYGIVELSLAGKVIGQRFDGYTEGVDADGERVSFGTVDLAAGPQPLTVTVVGRNPAATAQLISLKRILLRPLR